MRIIVGTYVHNYHNINMYIIMICRYKLLIWQCNKYHYKNYKIKIQALCKKIGVRVISCNVHSYLFITDEGLRDRNVQN